MKLAIFVIAAVLAVLTNASPLPGFPGFGGEEESFAGAIASGGGGMTQVASVASATSGGAHAGMVRAVATSGGVEGPGQPEVEHFAPRQGKGRSKGAPKGTNKGNPKGKSRPVKPAPAATPDNSGAGNSRETSAAEATAVSKVKSTDAGDSRNVKADEATAESTSKNSGLSKPGAGMPFDLGSLMGAAGGSGGDFGLSAIPGISQMPGIKEFTGAMQQLMSGDWSKAFNISQYSKFVDAIKTCWEQLVQLMAVQGLTKLGGGGVPGGVPNTL